MRQGDLKITDSHLKGNFMKFLATTFAFILTLGLTPETIANQPEAACTGQNTEKCAQQTNNKQTNAHETKSVHKDLSAEMNSLFPEKQKIAQLTATPAAVEITAPKFLSKITGPAKLEWKEAQGANAYHVQVATDPNFKWLVAEDRFVKTTSFTVNQTEAGRKYYWRVAAFNTGNDSMYAKSNFSSSVFVAK